MSLLPQRPIHSRSRFFALLTTSCLLGMTCLSACKRPPLSDPLPARTRLRLPVHDDVQTFDPAGANDSVSKEVTGQIFETLYQYGYLDQHPQLIPLLAADHPKISPDQKTLTIPLKRGILFSDSPCFKSSQGKGRELIAQDFVFAWKRLLLPSFAGTDSNEWVLSIAGASELRSKFLAAKTPQEIRQIFDQRWEGLRALDEYTLQVTLNHPLTRWPHHLTRLSSAPFPVEAVNQFGDSKGWVNEHPVGTGPFVLVKWEHGAQIRLVRNPTYHGDFFPTEGSPLLIGSKELADAGRPLPLTDEISFHLISDQGEAREKFVANKLDVLAQTESATETSPTAGAKSVNAPANRTLVLAIQSLPINHRLLKQALLTAIDPASLKPYFGPQAPQIATSLVPPALGLHGINSRPSYSRAQAKELLKRAGYSEGRGLSELRVDLLGNDERLRKVGDSLIEQWALVGVKISAELNTRQSFQEKLKLGQIQIALFSAAPNVADGDSLYSELAPWLGSRISNEYQKDLNQLLIESDSKKRVQYASRLERRLWEEGAVAPLLWLGSTQWIQPWVLNYRDAEWIIGRYKFVRVDQSLQRQAAF